MSWLNSYNSGNANTALPITTKSGYCLRYDYYTAGSTVYYSTTEYAINGSDLNYVAAASIPTGLLRVKVYNPNKKKVIFWTPKASSTSSINHYFPKNVIKVKSVGNYQYFYFNINAAVSVYLCPVYKDHTSSSTNHSYTYYYGLEMVEAVSMPGWGEKMLQIYDDGTNHLIPPTIYCDDNCNSNYAYNTTGTKYVWRIWETEPGNTYTLRCSSRSNMTLNGFVLGGSDTYGKYTYERGSTGSLSSSTYTTDPNTGEIVYTIKTKSAYPYLMVGYSSATSATLESRNPRLYGQRPAGWYDVDNYDMETTWKNTDTTNNSAT